ncbi:MAG: hypothetical protein KGS61_01250 [Verrucomicrobia bacterium]|nr:hypothetical protein [Verrucomicrobiota bacterium]
MACSLQLAAAEVDVGKLPPPAGRRIDFARDIRPILEKSCLRCHGPERPKSHFRLDNRVSALKGGENGVDIIPGHSERSPLIHNVAGLVEDMLMPPAGKGERLTAEQIGVLRAWIDQGVAWPEGGTNTLRFSFTPMVGWMHVSGDASKARELLWQRAGAAGGAQEFHFRQQVDPDTAVTGAGHVVFGQDDYKLTLAVERNDVGFGRFGFETYRKYFDDTGGYYAPFSPAAFDLNQDLYEDIGRIWTDFGLTLPDRPRVVVGYEYDFRNGTESLLQWGAVTDPGSGATKNIYPAYQNVNEHAHVIKVEVTHEIRGVQLEDAFRGEFYHLDTHQVNDLSYSLGSSGPAATGLIDQGYRHAQANNTFSLQKQVNPWLFLSGGYFYNRLQGDAAFSQSTLLMPTGGLFPYASGSDIVLAEETHVFNANAQLGPWAGWTGFAGVQSEWDNQHGFGSVQTDDADPTDPTTFLIQPTVVSSDWGTFRNEEDFGLRYTRIPDMVLFADTRFQQESFGELEETQPEGGGLLPHEFVQNTVAVSDLKEYRIGFDVSPWQRLGLNAQYLRHERRTDYNNFVTAFGLPNAGYPGFITGREIRTDEVDTKLSVRPAAWLTTTLSYRLVATDYRTATSPVTGFDPATGMLVPGFTSPGGWVFAGKYRGQVYSASAVLTPWRRVYLSSTFTYQPSRIRTADNSDPSMAPYRGDVYSVITSGNYALTTTTSLRAAYSFSHAGYGQGNTADGLPLGMVYDWQTVQAGAKRQFHKGVAIGLQYAFYRYAEASSGGLNNFTAHAVFAMFTKQLP